MKSKRQKQEEALARKRSFLQVHRSIWMDNQVLVTNDIIARANNGDKFAQGVILEAEVAKKSFEKAAAEAGVDLHGNRLNMVEVLHQQSLMCGRGLTPVILHVDEGPVIQGAEKSFENAATSSGVGVPGVGVFGYSIPLDTLTIPKQLVIDDTLWQNQLELKRKLGIQTGIKGDYDDTHGGCSEFDFA
jgi:hypothetical protein